MKKDYSHSTSLLSLDSLSTLSMKIVARTEHKCKMSALRILHDEIIH